ncbi:MAG: hypothetical protein IIX61_01355 [Loktanella sp.]|nr:hypothetical protein [Loktanella sp.]
MTRQSGSRGEMISTLCFAGVGLWCAGQALTATPWQAAGLAVAALACFAGAARHPLARLLSKVARK